MKIAVTGGAGFIASHAADAYIEAGHEVVILDNLSTGKKENLNPKAKFIEIDITSDKIKELLAEEKFDILNHHAAQMNVRVSVDDPKFDAHTNIIGGLNLYQAAMESSVKKVVFASTGGAVYGEQDYFPADEKHPQQPLSPYGIAKLANEKYLFYYKEVFGMEHTILRYANIYGPRQNSLGEAGVVAIFADKMLSGEQPVINGDGKNTRDYVYVGDVVRANLLAIKDDISGIFNVATAQEHDVNYIFRKLKELTASDCKEIHGEPKKGEQRRSVCSYEKFKTRHGWHPQVQLDDGLKKTVEFFKNQHE